MIVVSSLWVSFVQSIKIQTIRPYILVLLRVWLEFCLGDSNTCRDLATRHGRLNIGSQLITSSYHKFWDAHRRSRNFIGTDRKSQGVKLSNMDTVGSHCVLFT